MAIRILSGFNAADDTAGSFRFAWSLGAGTSADNITTGTFSHESMSSVLGTTSYTSFAVAVSGIASTDFTVTYTGGLTSPPYATYKLQYNGGGNIDIINTAATAVTNLLNALGFTSAHDDYTGNKLTGASFYTSNVTPYYYLRGTIGAASRKSDDFEPDDIADGAEADDGTPYSMSVTTAPIYNNFVLPHESKAACFTRSAAASVPWTYQHFFTHARGKEPWLLVDDTESTIHQTKSKAARWKPDRVVEDYDSLWDIAFVTYMRGRL